MDGNSAVAGEDDAEEVESAADAEVGDIDVLVLVGLGGLRKAFGSRRWPSASAL